jgi:hypothetical protein
MARRCRPAVRCMLPGLSIRWRLCSTGMTSEMHDTPS